MSDRVRMWCLRHGECENVTAGNAGAVPSAPLTGRGRHQAIQAARALVGQPITGIYSSTALRAQQTAQLLATGSGLEVLALPELAEAGIGRHEGTADPAVRKSTAEVLRAWVVDQDLQQRVADGETGQHVLDRMTAAFQQIASTHPGETVAVVGHVASLTLALRRLCALGQCDTSVLSGVRGSIARTSPPWASHQSGGRWQVRPTPSVRPISQIVRPVTASAAWSVS